MPQASKCWKLTQVGRIDLTQGFSRLCIYCSSVAHRGSESPCKDAASFPTVKHIISSVTEPRPACPRLVVIPWRSNRFRRQRPSLSSFVHFGFPHQHNSVLNVLLAYTHPLALHMLKMMKNDWLIDWLAMGMLGYLYESICHPNLPPCGVAIIHLVATLRGAAADSNTMQTPLQHPQ